MESSFVTGLFRVANFPGSSMLQGIPVLRSFLGTNNSPLYEYAPLYALYVFIHCVWTHGLFPFGEYYE